MPLLFFVSGMTAVYSYRSQPLTKYITKKSQRLLLPYLAWMTIHYLIVAALPLNYRTFGVTEFFSEIFNSDFWFLRHLFVYYLIMWLCLCAIATCNKLLGIKLNKEVLLCISIFIVVLLRRIPLLSNSISIWYYTWFLIGYFTNKYLLSRSYCQCPIIGVVALIFLLIATTLQYVYNIPSKIAAVVWVVGLTTVVFTLLHSSTAGIIRKIECIGMNTLPIYAIHWCLLFSPLWRLNIYTNLMGKWPLIISVAVTFFAWLLICLDLINGIRKLKWKWIRLLLIGEA